MKTSLNIQEPARSSDTHEEKRGNFYHDDKELWEKEQSISSGDSDAEVQSYFTINSNSEKDFEDQGNIGIP